MIRRPVHFLGALLLAASLGAPSVAMRAPGPKGRAKRQAPVRVRASRDLMNTIVEITVFAPSEAAGRRAIEQAYAEMSRVEAVFSRYRRDSVISRLNREAGRRPIKVSGEVFCLLQRCVEFSRLTDGAFDITVTPFIALWRDAARRGVAPTPEETQRAKVLVGWRLIRLDAAHQTVGFAREGVQLDLGGIAKGYAIDRAIAALQKAGIRRALVNAGGDVYGLGSKPGGRAWNVGIQDPRRPAAVEALIQVIEVMDAGVATSGNYRRFTVIQGRRYSHILDPRTGIPADAVPSVSVLAPDATTADALATGLSVLGVAKGLALVEKWKDVEALLVTVEEGRLKRHVSAGFPRAAR